MRRGWVFWVLLALALGAVLRLSAQRGEFWLDEVLSYNLAREAGSPVGVFAVKHDNNHHLNTAWLTLWPEAAPWWLYRLLSVAAGLAAIVVAALVARRWGEAEAVFAAWLVATNYWLVIASAEARGYSLAVLFALAAFGALWRYLDDGRRPWLVLFWVTACLGFLSHLTFVHAYIGFVVWSLRRFAKDRVRPGDELRRLAICHAGVVAFFAPFYLYCIRGMHVEGGPPGRLWPPIERLLAVPLGSELFPLIAGRPVSQVVNPVLVFCSAGLFLGGLKVLSERKSDLWVFFLVAVVASPTVFLLRPPPILFERYFYISYAFFVLLVAQMVGFRFRQVLGRLGRVRAVLFCFGFFLLLIAGNLAALWSFAGGGRGRFAEALAFVLEQDASVPVKVTGDDDFRVGAMLGFHAGYFPDREVVYVSNNRPGEAEWVLVHRLNDRDPVEDEVRDTAGNVYKLGQRYPARGPSAWGWFVYRRER
ncbi:MAG: glycosyltransferase family 39 protein [Gemmataceae bacterium]